MADCAVVLVEQGPAGGAPDLSAEQLRLSDKEVRPRLAPPSALGRADLPLPLLFPPFLLR